MKVYVAGPMASMPDHNFPAFEERARPQGHEVVSPHEHAKPEDVEVAIAGGEAWKDDARYCGYLREDLKLMLECEAVSVLPGWEKSTGAGLEVHVANVLRMPVYEAEVPSS